MIEFTKLGPGVDILRRVQQSEADSIGIALACILTVVKKWKNKKKRIGGINQGRI
jgi:hypothetical protein